MLAGLRRLKSKGSELAELTVDCENKAARTLCGSLGLEIRTGPSSYDSYEKVLKSEPAAKGG